MWKTLPTSPPHCNVEPTPSPVATANVSQTATDAMVLMTAMTTVTKSTVELTTPLVPLLHSPVPISAVCLQDGAVMGTMTVLITVMRSTAPHMCLEPALQISLPVLTTAVSHIPGVVILTMTVGTVQMKLTAIWEVRAIQDSFSVQTTAVSTPTMSVMGIGTVWMGRMSRDASITAL